MGHILGRRPMRVHTSEEWALYEVQSMGWHQQRHGRRAVRSRRKSGFVVRGLQPGRFAAPRPLKCPAIVQKQENKAGWVLQVHVDHFDSGRKMMITVGVA